MGEQTDAAKINGKYTIINALISGLCLVISAFIGIFSFDIRTTNKILVTENTELSVENYNYKTAYKTLQEQFDNLVSQNTSLLNEIDNIKISMEEYSTIINENAVLKDENDILKNEVTQLQSELQIVKSTYANESRSQNSIGLTSDKSNARIQITGTYDVRVRSAPSTSSSVIKNVTNGTIILFIKTVTGIDGNEWYEVIVGDETGYVRSDLARIVE